MLLYFPISTITITYLHCRDPNKSTSTGFLVSGGKSYLGGGGRREEKSEIQFRHLKSNNKKELTVVGVPSNKCSPACTQILTL